MCRPDARGEQLIYDRPLLANTTAYNERFMTTGDTGFGGGINWPATVTFVQYGFASMSMGDEHDSDAGMHPGRSITLKLLRIGDIAQCTGL